jgi:release factor glutamine methyltransferase
MSVTAVATIRGVLTRATTRIATLDGDEATLEAEILLMHALGVDRAHLYQRLPDELDANVASAFKTLVHRRLAHEPVAYITGHREFFGLDFEVTPAALIPRPETETLVELALAYARGRSGAVTIADIGTGCGAIAVALAHELPNANVIATDDSADALALATRNAQHITPGRIDFRRGDLLAPISEPVDIIVANLPYVTTEQWEAMPPEIRDHEPRSALDGGVDGLEVIRRLIADAPSHLGAGGALFCEIGDWQGADVLALPATAFPTAHVEVHPDLAGRDRVLAVYC